MRLGEIFIMQFTETNAPYGNHEELSRVLPWYVNNSLGELDTQRVEQHLRVCATCSGEMKILQQMAGCLANESCSGRSVDVAYAGFRKSLATPSHWMRIKECFTGLVNVCLPVGGSRAQVAAMVLMVCIGVLSLALPTLSSRMSDLSEVDAGVAYRTYSSDKVDSGNAAYDLKVIFAESVGAIHIDEILKSAHTDVVDENRQGKRFKLKLTDDLKNPDALEQIIVDLKQRPEVIFVEPSTQLARVLAEKKAL